MPFTLAHPAAVLPLVRSRLIFSALGAGGGVLAVPVLMFVFHLPLPRAIGTALAILFATALVSSLVHFRRGNVDARVALAFGGAALCSAPLGAWAHRLIPERVTLSMFCAVLGGSAIRMWLHRPDAEARGAFAWLPTVALGLAVGLLTGLLGVGGGLIAVPVLTTLLGVPVRRAVGTSAAVVCASSLSGAVSYALVGSVEWAALGTVGVGAAQVCAEEGAALARDRATMLAQWRRQRVGAWR